MKFKKYAHAWSEQVESTQRLNLAKKPRFILFHNPKNWELVTIKQSGKKKDKVYFLPKLNQLILSSGVNNVRQNGKTPDARIAIANLNADGCTVLAPEKHDYLVSYKVIGGKRYDTKFNEYEQIGSTIIQNFNHEAFNQFRKQLVLDGHIDLPHQHFIKLMILRNKPLINKYAKQQHEITGKMKYEEAIEFENSLKEVSKQVKEQGLKAYE